MPIFVLMCLDKPGALALRMANREAHLAFVARRRGEVRLAGPLLNDEGDMSGSLLIIEADDLAAARAFNAADPYQAAGLFERVEIRSFRQSIPPPP